MYPKSMPHLDRASLRAATALIAVGNTEAAQRAVNDAYGRTRPFDHRARARLRQAALGLGLAPPPRYWTPGLAWPADLEPRFRRALARGL
jgi:hypothetical protein